MKNVLLPAAILALALSASAALAAPKTPSIYMVNGHVVSPQEALQAALKDLNVLQCKPVAAVVSKGGNSIRLAAKKARN